MPTRTKKDETKKAGAIDPEVLPPEEPQEPRREGVLSTLMSLPGVAAIAERLKDFTLKVELSPPDEQTLELLSKDPQEIIKEAKEFQVIDDDTYKLAKQAADSLKLENAELDKKRLDSGSAALTILKKSWDSLFSVGTSPRKTAIDLYHGKMQSYENKRKREDEENRKRQQKAAAQQKENLRSQAKALEEKAAKLKSDSKKRELLEQAEQLKAGAEMIPEEFGESQTSVPSLGSGSKSYRWKGSVHEDDQEFAGWLLKNPEWRGKIVRYEQSGLDDLADAVKDNKEVAGFKAERVSSYRREARRK